MIERRRFGGTGHSSTVTLLGAAALARVSQDEAERALALLLRHGVNHIDTAAGYGDSELRIGPWMARHRKDFFLATKTRSRSAAEACEDIHRSLERLRVDRPRGLGHRGPDSRHVVSAARGAGGHRPRGALADRLVAGRRLHQHGGRSTRLPKVFAAAERFERQPADEEMTAMQGSRRMRSLFGLPT